MPITPAKAKYMKRYREENKEAIKAQRAEYRKDHKEDLYKKNRKWKLDNKEKVASHSKSYYGKHKDKLLQGMVKHTAKRNAAKMERIPSWANKKKIAIAYKLAKMLEAMRFTPTSYHIDHYYPLQGTLVSGLHCESNLRVVTALENQTKFNNMPTECKHA